MSNKYCILGFPVRHSFSPKIHNAWFRKYGIKAKYESCEIEPRRLAEFMKSYRDRFLGGNVTIPHKEKIMKYLDWISSEAKKIGAVNTIVNSKGKLFGYNTDTFGAMTALRTKITSLRGKNILVLGAGGAARAVIYGLKKSGAKIWIYNRTLSRAKKLAREFAVTLSLSKGDTVRQAHHDYFDLIVNTTSVGMWPAVSASPLPDLPLLVKGDLKKPLVMDIIYRPRMTKFLRDAKKAGCKIITGDKMFMAQAAASFKLWTSFVLR